MKVGDRVSLLKNDYSGDEMVPGQLGSIVYVGEDLIEVVLDNGYADEDEELAWPFYHYELEVIE